MPVFLSNLPAEVMTMIGNNLPAGDSAGTEERASALTSRHATLSGKFSIIQNKKNGFS